MSVKQEILELINNSPDLSLFDVKDGNGNQIIDAGKHALPGALIGAGIALYADSIRRKIPNISTKVAMLGTFIAASTYEGAEACGDYVPDAHSIVETCQKGFIDGNNAKYATMDGAIDMFVTVGCGAAAAFVVSNALFSARRNFRGEPFYRMSKTEELEYLQQWDVINPEDRKIIEIVQDNATS